MYLRCPPLLLPPSSVPPSPSSPSSPDPPVHYLTPGTTSLLPPRWRLNHKSAFLLPREEFSPYAYPKQSHRTWQPPAPWVDTSPPRAPSLPWQSRATDWDEKEKPLIDLAFDKPEAIPLFLKDLSIRGYADVMAPRWVEKAQVWVRQARYWRVIGVYYPFYHPHRLRIHLWRHDVNGRAEREHEQGEQGGRNPYESGPQIGAPKFSMPMVDALYDLEKAYRRKELGLPPNYRWEGWSPVGFRDGRMNDWLPRLPSMRWDPDPDGVVLRYEELGFVLDAPENTENPMAVHEMLQKRYYEFIWTDTTEYDECFRETTGVGGLIARDVVLSPECESLGLTDMRDRVYAAALEKHLYPRGISAGRTKEQVQELIQKVRQDSDAKVEGMRLFYNASSDLDWIRGYIEERTGIGSFVHTPDRTLTQIIGRLLAEMHRVMTEYEWGPALARCSTLYEYEKAIGPVPFEVAMAIQNANLDRRREKWNERFSGEGKEEQTLNMVLQKMSRRPQSQPDVNNSGDQFDRETEPVGRHTQRRVLPADKQGGKGKFWERREQKQVDFEDNIVARNL